MVDWDELLEDVNWTALISLLVLGIILIGLAVFVGLDWSRTNSIKTKLNNSLDSYEEYNQKLAVPDYKQNFKKQQDDFNDFFKPGNHQRLPLAAEFTRDQMTNLVSNLAAENGVVLASRPVFNERNETLYIKSYTAKISFRSSDTTRAASFYKALEDMSVPHTNTTPSRLAPNIDIDMEITFYVFDQQAWESSTDCKVDLPEPAAPDVDLSKLRIFKSKVEDLEKDARQQQAGLKNTRTSYENYCKEKNKIDRLRLEVEFIKNTWGE